MIDPVVSSDDELQLSFVSMAAHELRTPLTAIIGYVESLKRSLGPSLTTQQDHELKQLAASSKLLENLIENLLNVSHIASGSFEIHQAPTDLVGLTREVVERFQDQAKGKSQMLKVSLPDVAPPLVLADRVRIGQVLSNLIINAINFTNKGGNIEVSVFIDEGKFVGARVADNGVGIADRELPNIFNKYFRTKGALKAGSKGTGLGLFISKQIMDLHKGELSVESREGFGSKFTIKIPIASPEDVLESK